MPYLEREHYRIHYEWGPRRDGPVLILSHSLGANSRMWNTQIEALSHRFRVLLYDHPGHGRSDNRPAVGTIADYGEDVLALMDKLDIETACFCGLSLGGMAGIWLGAHAADRFEKLVLCNTTAKIENPELLKRRIAEIRHNGLDGITESVLEKWLTPEFRRTHPETVDKLRSLCMETDAGGYADTAETVCSMDLRGALKSIPLPVLVIYGAHDKATPPEWNIKIANEVQGARIVCLETAHLSNVEAPEEFNRAVLGFL
ncbi:MAG: 3-oxoadipate enol-lactonase [Spirochaetaceae bacterium]